MQNIEQSVTLQRCCNNLNRSSVPTFDCDGLLTSASHSRR